MSHTTNVLWVTVRSAHMKVLLCLFSVSLCIVLFQYILFHCPLYVLSPSASEETLSKDILWIYNLFGFLTYSVLSEISSTLSSNTIISSFDWFLGILHFLCPPCIACWYAPRIPNPFSLLSFYVSCEIAAFPSASVYTYLWTISNLCPELSNLFFIPQFCRLG